MQPHPSQPSLLSSGSEIPLSGRSTLTDRVAGYFRALPNCWIDAHDLMKVGGFAGWRTRISELRHAPYFMQIVNRTRRVDGYTVSEYKWEA